MSVDWSYFERFEDVIDRYMPSRGEGDTEATQIVTAVNKLIYKWYNDGDVFDNTSHMNGWCNDLSSYANWLRQYAAGDTGCDDILDKIYKCRTKGDYEDLLKELADALLDADWLELMNGYEKTGSIYNCDGPYRFEEYDEDEEWDDDWEPEWDPE